MMEEELDLIDLKHNILPRGLTPLEDLFDSNDVPKRPKMEPVKSDIEECNIGKNEKPKMIKLSKSLSSKEKVKYIELDRKSVV